MPTDPFRLILILGAVIVVPIALVHRLRAHVPGEHFDRRAEGPLVYFTLRPLGFLYMLGLIATMVSPASVAWGRMPLPTAARWGGVAMGALGAALLLWTLRSLGKNLTDTVATRADATLVTRGPYRYVRHPFYVAVALALAANAFIAASWFLLVTGAGVFALLVVRTPREEAGLVAKFGDAYRAYRERTGAFWPRAPRG